MGCSTDWRATPARHQVSVGSGVELYNTGAGHSNPKEMLVAICEICGKGPLFGNAVARLGKNAIRRRVKARTKRAQKPNIQRITVWVNGTSRRMYVCTRCIRRGLVQRPPVKG